MDKNKERILHMTAISIAKSIKEGEITCLEVLTIFINNIKRLNPKINALAYDCFDEAINIAEQYDIRYIEKKKKKNLDDLPIFFGVPIIIKECFELKDRPFTFGLSINKNNTGNKTCNVCKQLVSNGIIIIGAGNLAEGCYWIETNNPIYGLTSNPYNVLRSAGGSSGGNASLIAISGAPLGLASDSGGSIRLPAFYNGIFGHKPTGGLIPSFSNTIYNEEYQEGDYYYSQAGPMTKYACDLWPLLKTMLNPNRKVIDKLIEPKSLTYKNLKVIDISDSFELLYTINPDIKESISNLKKFFISKGAIVENKSYSDLEAAFFIWTKAIEIDGTLDLFIKNNRNSSFRQNISQLLMGEASFTTLGVNLLSYFKEDSKTSPETIKTVRELKEKIKRKLLNDLHSNEYTILLCPTFVTTAPFHGKSYKYILEVGMLGIFNILGFPVTQIPLGLNNEKMPLGAQLIGLPFNDKLTIKIAELLEKDKYSKWIPPPMLL
ncbi:Amidase [seawater metagenome]|uniref:Amidase n=1 Tax=seawater metagenome TaxID=1561972 RepID=A0A5E8CL70_9ZZZZ